MKKLIIPLCSLALVFGLVGMASALPYTDVYNANLFMSSGQSVAWTFDITDDGFDPVLQDVTSASISLNLVDDSNRDFWEVADLRVGANRFFWEVDTGVSSFYVNSLMSLSTTGTVSARLIAIIGDFWFKESILRAEGTELIAEGTDPPGGGSTPVPEPETMMILGFVLLGLVGVSRKRFNRIN